MTQVQSTEVLNIKVNLKATGKVKIKKKKYIDKERRHLISVMAS